MPAICAAYSCTPFSRAAMHGSLPKAPMKKASSPF